MRIVKYGTRSVVGFVKESQIDRFKIKEHGVFIPLKFYFLKIIVINSDLFWSWAVSSVGRASRLHRGGQRFESFTAHQNSGGCSSVG